jgi:hypothetical protein
MTVWNIFTAIRYLLWPFRNVVVIWYIFPRFGILREEKSGNPGVATKRSSVGAAQQRCWNLAKIYISLKDYTTIYHDICVVSIVERFQRSF